MMKRGDDLRVGSENKLITHYMYYHEYYEVGVPMGYRLRIGEGKEAEAVVERSKSAER